MFNKTRRFVTAWIGGPYGVIVFIALIFFLYFTVVMLAFVAVDFSAKLGMESPSWAISVTECASEGFVAAMLSVSLVPVTVWGLLLPGFNHINHRRQLQTRQIVEIREIENPGRDDIETLSDLLKDAGRSIIFAGSFDWLLKHERVREIVNALATEEQIRLVSSRPAESETVLRSLSRNTRGANKTVIM